MKYKEWLEEWLINYIKPTSKERTYQRYAEIVNQHIIPYLGEYELDELTPIILQKFVSQLLEKGNIKTKKGLSANSVNAVICVIQGSLKSASILGVCKKYIADKIKRPKSIEKKVLCFTLTEQKKIENAVKKDKRLKMVGIILSLYTGLRIGELLALEWSDIDFSKGELIINKSCHDGKNKEGQFVRIIDTPKTESSRRTIPFPKQLVNYLMGIKKKSKSRYVVGNGEKVISIRSYQKTFSSLLVSKNISHKGFHALRHTFATRAIECGMDVKTLSEILGHKSPTVTLNRYVHSLMEHKKEMMNKVGGFF